MSPSSILSLSQILQPIENDLAEFESRLINIISPSSRSLCAILQDIFQSGGKRIRPALTLLFAKNLEISKDEKIFLIAEISELIHTASLVHDDIIDNSFLRRGKATIHSKWDKAVTVISGDFMFARAAVNLAKIGFNQITEIFANVLQELCDGEIWQVEHKYTTKLDYNYYYEKTYKKTASLFEAACLAPILYLSNDTDLQLAAKSYGKNLGMAFQIIDDILDFTTSSDVLGKPSLADLRDGQINLPILISLEAASRQDFELLTNSITNLNSNKDDLDSLNQVYSLIQKYQGIELSYQKAKEYIEEARSNLKIFPQNSSKESLDQILDFVITRSN